MSRYLNMKEAGKKNGEKKRKRRKNKNLASLAKINMHRYRAKGTGRERLPGDLGFRVRR